MPNGPEPNYSDRGPNIHQETRLIDPKYSEVIDGADNWVRIRRASRIQRWLETAVTVSSAGSVLFLTHTVLSVYPENSQATMMYGFADLTAIIIAASSILRIIRRRGAEQDENRFREELIQDLLARENWKHNRR